MRSEKGLAIHKFLILIVVLMMFVGVTTYVVMQDNGIHEREIEPLVEKALTTNSAKKLVFKDTLKILILQKPSVLVSEPVKEKGSLKNPSVEKIYLS